MSVRMSPVNVWRADTAAIAAARGSDAAIDAAVGAARA